MIFLIRQVSIIGLITLFVSACNQQKAKLIIPPIASIEQKYEWVNFDAQKGGTLTTERGSVLEVPADAFIDSLGNLVNGIVELQYREMHDTQGIFLSGIPMEVRSGDKTDILSSAVMWEVRAFQQGHSLELDTANNKTIKASIASSVESSEYDLWNLDENTGNWVNLNAAQPIPNPARIEADSIVKLTKAKLPDLDLSNCVVFNYYDMLDVWKPKDKVFNYYYGSEGSPEKAYTRKLKKRVEGFGMNWVNPNNYYQYATFYGMDYPASMLVWEVEGKIPQHIRNSKEVYYACESVNRHRYRFTFYKYGNSDEIIYSVMASIKMPLKSLYKVGKENWNAEKDSLTTLLEAQEKRMATLGSVLRRMEIAKMGIYNYDILLDKEDILIVDASFTMSNDEILDNEDLMVFVYLEKENTVIRYDQYDMDKFVIYPKADYKIFCVVGPKQMAWLPKADLKEITGLIPLLKNQQRPPVQFKMVEYENNISSSADFNDFLANVENLDYL